jgi:hypothetical protein
MICAKKLKFHIHFEYSSAIDENTYNSEFEMKNNNGTAQ